MAEIAVLKPNVQAGPVARSLEDGILRVTLANPPANALSLSVIAALGDAFEAARADPSVRVIVLNAAGKLFFLGALFVLISIPVTAPMVFAADRFAAAMKRSPRVTRVIDYLFAGIFSAFALKIISAQAK